MLGSAFVLAGPLQLDEIRLETGAGVVPVRLEREGARIVFGRMEQPIPTVEPYGDATAARGARRRAVGAARRAVRQRAAARLRGARLARRRSPRSSRTSRRSPSSTQRSASTASPARGRRWKTRMFAPRAGVAEDPATGSAAGPLALHLARHGRIAFGDEIEITQGVEIERPSKLYARVDGRAEQVERVEVGGSAVIVARGEFQLALRRRLTVTDLQRDGLDLRQLHREARQKRPPSRER